MLKRLGRTIGNAVANAAASTVTFALGLYFMIVGPPRGE
jgi:hypothetical protein